jgi:hypothetical protein
MMPSGITFKVRLIKLRFQGCYALLVFMIDYNLLSRHRKSPIFTNGGLNISKLRALFRKHSVFTDLLMTTVQ